MCMSSPKMPPPLPPPAPVAPPLVATLAPVSKADPAQASNRGRSALRIDRTQTASGTAGSGLNIPT